MKLTEREKEICKKYSAKDAKGHVHCDECPLNLMNPSAYKFDECPLNLGVCELKCYAVIDGRTSEAKSLKRF